jgi:hypothetical protein
MLMCAKEQKPRQGDFLQGASKHSLGYYITIYSHEVITVVAIGSFLAERSSTVVHLHLRQRNSPDTGFRD